VGQAGSRRSSMGAGGSRRTSVASTGRGSSSGITETVTCYSNVAVTKCLPALFVTILFANTV